MYVMIRVNQRNPAADVNLHFNDDQGWYAFEKMCSIARHMYGYVDQLLITYLDDSKQYAPVRGVNIIMLDQPTGPNGKMVEEMTVMYCDYRN